MANLEDGPTDVYLTLIEGPTEALVPSARGTDCRWSKVGRTANLARRVAELASGLQPDSAIRHVPLAVRHFRAAREAHKFERRMLDFFNQQGWALGGEFALAPPGEVRLAISVKMREK